MTKIQDKNDQSNRCNYFDIPELRHSIIGDESMINSDVWDPNSRDLSSV